MRLPFRKPNVLVIEDENYRRIELAPGDTYTLTVDVDMFGDSDVQMSRKLNIQIKYYWDGFKLRRVLTL